MTRALISSASKGVCTFCVHSSSTRFEGVGILKDLAGLQAAPPLGLKLDKVGVMHQLTAMGMRGSGL